MDPNNQCSSVHPKHQGALGQQDRTVVLLGFYRLTGWGPQLVRAHKSKGWLELSALCLLLELLDPGFPLTTLHGVCLCCCLSFARHAISDMLMSVSTDLTVLTTAGCGTENICHDLF